MIDFLFAIFGQEYLQSRILFLCSCVSPGSRWPCFGHMATLVHSSCEQKKARADVGFVTCCLLSFCTFYSNRISVPVFFCICQEWLLQFALSTLSSCSTSSPVSSYSSTSSEKKRFAFCKTLSAMIMMMIVIILMITILPLPLQMNT